MNLLTPLGLALGALAAPLVALYFLRIRRRRVTVPSLLAWHALQQRDKLASPFQRFRRDLLLFLQLAILALIAAAAARPYVLTPSAPWHSVVLVVDTSASMGATDEGGTRWAAAVARAGELLDRVGPTDEVMLVVAGPRTEVVVPFTRDEARVRSALAALGPTEAEGTLGEGLQLALSLARSRSDTEVVVFSDGGNRDLSGVPGAVGPDGAPIGGVRIRYERVGVGDRNAGIVALDLRRSPARDLERQLFVTVRSFGREPVRASVEVTLAGELVGLRAETLPPDEPVSLVFDLTGEVSGDLRVRLDSPGDLLPADDIAWAVVEPAGARRVLLVGGDALTARALLADPRAAVRRVASSEVTPALLAAHDAVIFGAAVPDGLDGLDYAVLGPAHGGPVRFGEEVVAPGVVEQQRTHPLLRFVDLTPVTFGAARAVVDAGGLVPVVQGDAGPLVLAGERAGGRVVQLAFDPLDTDLPLRVAWPVMLLNLVGWLTEDEPGASESNRFPTGLPYVRRVPEGVDAAQVTGPSGPVPAVVEAGTVRASGLDRVGVYEVRAGDLRERFAANLLSEEESRIAPRAALGLEGDGVGPVDASRSAVGRRELWRLLLGLALAMVVVEWATWNWRRSA